MSTGISYRVATPEDAPTVVRLLMELIEELGPADMADELRPLIPTDIEKAMQSADVRVFFVEDNQQPVGLIRGDILYYDPIFRLRPDRRCGYVDQLFVRPAYRDRGVGLVLMRMIEDWFREQQLEHCLLHSAPKAVRFYSRMGYQPNREFFKKLT